MLESPTDGPESESDLDAVFDALAHRHRRYVVDVLEGRERAMNTADLARDVAELDGRADPDATRRVRTELYHRHLPRMASAGVVTVDDGMVRLSADGGTTGVATALLSRVE